MERWSAIHNTYKFFKLGRPLYLEEIKKDKEIQKRIKLLNRFKNYCKKNNIDPPDLSKIPKNQLRKHIIKILPTPH
ncbi:MAG: hypothetical protein ABIB79_03395 [archaeon]